MITNLNNLRAQAAQAKREWEELDPKYTSFEMRKKVETRYLTLRALVQRMEPVQAPVVKLRAPDEWRTAAIRAARA